jgi:exosortase/archaeosortase family protein
LYSSALTRAHLAALMAAGIATNYIVDKLSGGADTTASLPDRMLSAIAEANLIQLFAWYAACVLLHAASPRLATTRDMAAAFLIAFTMVVANLLAAPLLFGVAVTAGAIYLFATSKDDTPLRAAATVLTALTLNAIWGPLAFSICAEAFLWADTNVVVAALKLLKPDISIAEFAVLAPDGHRIVILDQCSAFHNITLAMLACAAMAMLTRQRWRMRDTLILTAACALMFAMNAARIFLMALGRESYVYWHDGQGAALFGLVVTMTIFALSYLGIRMSERKA